MATYQKTGSKGQAGRLGVALTKSTKLLKIFKAAKFLKILLTVGTGFLSVIVYAFQFSLWFAIGLVVMLFIHEMGHVIALKRKGFAASAPIFIPMLGAVIFAPNMGNREDEAYVGYAGPLVGTIAALVLLTFTAQLNGHAPTLALISYVGLMINLFNLIPIRPMDGGRVTQSIGPWFRYIGVVLLVALTMALKSPGLLLIWILVLGEFKANMFRTVLGWSLMGAMLVMELGHIGMPESIWLIAVDFVIALICNLLYMSQWRKGNARGQETDDRPQLDAKSRIKWLGLYLVLAIVLVAAMFVNGHYLPSGALKQIQQYLPPRKWHIPQSGSFLFIS